MPDREVRQIHDSKVLAAMSHPVRRRLMDVLSVYGPATASALAERTGQAVGNISHHLKVLAASELVEEAPELARDKRERWWRRPKQGLAWSSTDFEDDPVAEAAESLSLERANRLARAWFANRLSYPEEWHDVGFDADIWLRLSVSEIDELKDKILDLITPLAHRKVPDDGQEREPVFFSARAVPGKP
ncbi:ArsR/SmtB family transcription factor [Amycolatopsis sp. H20-H5]|uniref:ArsR/SmtB family transcription factor n=1 Tax=Amycolatopsis sp. H20-H5 TaxID=3046309 RepID=UPI002DB77AAD|nr:helix-turn-helix domain-containing protein [Amycolatopsis sp. H20-H5]MEC3981526.1 helix-turn-helix domain-containing protein [Amycolatopsis sp. H20-H5]